MCRHSNGGNAYSCVERDQHKRLLLTQIRFPHTGMAGNLVRASLKHHTSRLQHVRAVRMFQRRVGVLLDQQTVVPDALIVAIVLKMV